MGNGETTLHAAPAQSGSLVDSASGTRESQAQPAVASDPLTERSVKTWSAGAFDRIAAGYRGDRVD